VKPSVTRVASLHVAGYFSVGDLIFFGKYKNKRGRIVSFGRTEKGNPTVEVEPIPKGRKKNKTFGLFKIWHTDVEKRGSTDAVVKLDGQQYKVLRTGRSWEVRGPNGRTAHLWFTTATRATTEHHNAAYVVLDPGADAESQRFPIRSFSFTTARGGWDSDRGTWFKGACERVAALHMAKEWASEKQRKKYLQDHPKADPKRHTVKGPASSKGRGKSLADAALAKIQGVKKALADAVRAAPEETQKFLFDKEHRQKRTKETAEVLKTKAPQVKKSLWESLKSEADSFPKAGRILSRLIKGGKLEKGDLRTLYGVSVYVAGGIAGAMSGGLVGAAIFGGAKALLHSFSLHVGIKACSALFDEGFLGVEAAETVATFAGANLPFTTGDIPGFGKILDVIKDVVLAADDKGSKDPVRKFVDALYDQIVKDMEKGYSDADMRSMLQGKVPA